MGPWDLKKVPSLNQVVCKWNSIQPSTNEFDSRDVNNLLGWASYYVSKGGGGAESLKISMYTKRTYLNTIVEILTYSNWSC
jgi:hypothetical protein